MWGLAGGIEALWLRRPLTQLNPIRLEVLAAAAALSPELNELLALVEVVGDRLCLAPFVQFVPMTSNRITQVLTD